MCLPSYYLHRLSSLLPSTDILETDLGYPCLIREELQLTGHLQKKTLEECWNSNKHSSLGEEK